MVSTVRPSLMATSSSAPQDPHEPTCSGVLEEDSAAVRAKVAQRRFEDPRNPMQSTEEKKHILIALDAVFSWCETV